jgi:hypothetical protein
MIDGKLLCSSQSQSEILNLIRESRSCKLNLVGRNITATAQDGFRIGMEFFNEVQSEMFCASVRETDVRREVGQSEEGHSHAIHRGKNLLAKKKNKEGQRIQNKMQLDTKITNFCLVPVALARELRNTFFVVRYSANQQEG